MRRSRRDYRKDWRDNNRRERMTLIASSAFVLAALTVSGVYLRNQSVKQQNDGYTIDFTALESNVARKSDEIAEAQSNTGGHWSSAGSATDSAMDGAQPGNGNTKSGTTTDRAQNGQSQGTESLTASSSVVKSSFGNELEDELDYMPLEADDHTVEIAEPADEVLEEAAAEEAIAFTGMSRPISGEILLPYSMDSSVYFATLDQYKYNPAVLYQASEDTTVAACGRGRVTDIYEDAEIGRALKLDLGDGYEAIYGQLKEIYVVENAMVQEGEVLGTVAAPTKYYSVEGTNLYFELKKDGAAVNPEGMYR